MPCLGRSRTRQLTADFDKVGIHGRGVGMRHDQCRTHTACRTNRSKDIGAFISPIAYGAWPHTGLAPDIGERSLLAYAGFIPRLRGGRL